MEQIIVQQKNRDYIIEILYEDNHIIVVYKPSGILSQKDSTNDKNIVDIIKDYIKNKYQKPGNVYLGLIHRLDRMTEGIMVLGKTSKASSRLSKMFSEKNDKIIKKYLTIVNGKFPINERDILVNYLLKDENLVKSFVTTADKGKLAKLEYWVIDSIDNYSLLEVNLLTGRHHQIRVQFANINHPLVGDSLYKEGAYGQLLLCAYSLSFIHPVNKKEYVFKVRPKNKMFETFSLQKVDFDSIICKD